MLLRVAIHLQSVVQIAGNVTVVACAVFFACTMHEHHHGEASCTHACKHVWPPSTRRISSMSPACLLWCWSGPIVRKRSVKHIACMLHEANNQRKYKQPTTPMRINLMLLTSCHSVGQPRRLTEHNHKQVWECRHMLTALLNACWKRHKRPAATHSPWP